MQMPRLWVRKFFTDVLIVCRVITWTAVADRPRLTPEKIDEILANNQDWLTSHTAEGYDAASFDFLPPDEWQRLSTAVKEVRTVAGELGWGDSATAEQRDRAKPAFKTIIELLEFDRFNDPDAYVLGKMIERRLSPIPLPYLDHLRFRTGPDSTDDPALWVWVFVREKEVGEYDREAFFAAVDGIEPSLKRATEEVLQKEAPERWPYISYRSLLEQIENEAVA